MADIVTNLEQVVEANEGKASKSGNTKKYMEATKKFEELVEKGVVEKRGYTLMTTVEDNPNPLKNATLSSFSCIM